MVKRIAMRKRDHKTVSTGKRSRPRSHVSLPGNLVTPIRGRPVVFEDISAAGARVSGEDLPGLGEFVRLTVANTTVFASVVWREGDECGLVFDHSMTDATVAEFRRVAEDARRLGLTPDMIRAQADWNNGL